MSISGKFTFSVNHLIYLSIVPTSQTLVYLCGKQLRAIPALELYIALTADYPDSTPLICIDKTSFSMPFYEPYRDTILEKIR
jgi:hypothetical protein